MFKKIKYLLYKKGYLKLGPLERKIDYLLTYPDINKFHSFYYNYYVKSLTPDIVNHIKLLKKLNDLDISGEKLDYSIAITNITIAEWLTDKGLMLNSKDKVIETWLKECKKLVIKTELLLNKVATGNEYHNFNILKNVYGDISNTIETIVEHIVTS